MDNKLVNQSSRSRRNRKWILGLAALFIIIALGGYAIFSQIGVAKTERNKTVAFNKIKWRESDGTGYLNRNKMIKNLMASDTLKPLNKQQIIELLGEPDRSDKDYLFYKIAQERMGFVPIHTTTLVIKVSLGGNAVMLHE